MAWWQGIILEQSCVDIIGPPKFVWIYLLFYCLKFFVRVQSNGIDVWYRHWNTKIQIGRKKIIYNRANTIHL